ncbi:MAG: hypothetical protein KDK23_05385 [Leptospiraceae bacterium]|nr:hypothetical protein [Leptospiraceae bacterium]
MDEKFRNRFIQRIEQEKYGTARDEGLRSSGNRFRKQSESIESFAPGPGLFDRADLASLSVPTYRKTFHLLYFLFFGAIAGTLVLGLSVSLIIPLFFRGTYENIAAAYGWW